MEELLYKLCWWWHNFYGINKNAEKVVSKLKAIAEKLFTQFPRNESKANLDKRHVLLSTFITSGLQKPSWDSNSIIIQIPLQASNSR